jgi:hypothetical protein
VFIEEFLTSSLLKRSISFDLLQHTDDNSERAADGKKMQEVQCGNDGCTVSDDPLDPCLPIAIPDDDYDFAANRCLKFVRSMPVPLLNCHIGLYVFRYFSAFLMS